MLHPLLTIQHPTVAAVVSIAIVIQFGRIALQLWRGCSKCRAPGRRRTLRRRRRNPLRLLHALQRWLKLRECQLPCSPNSAPWWSCTSSAIQDTLKHAAAVVRMGIAREQYHPGIRHDILRPPGAAGSTTAASAGSTGGNAGLKRGRRLAFRKGFLAIPLSSCMSSGAQGSKTSSSSSSSCCAAPGCCCSEALRTRNVSVSSTVREQLTLIGRYVMWLIDLACRRTGVSSISPCSSCSHGGPSSPGPQSIPPPSSSSSNASPP